MPDFFQRTMDIYLDVSGPSYPARFLAANRSNAGGAVPRFYQGDYVKIRIWLCVPPTAFGAEATTLANDGPVILCIKQKRDVAFPAVGMATGLTLVTDTEGTRYEGYLNLAGDTALGLQFPNSGNLTVACDIALQGNPDASGATPERTFSFDSVITRQVFGDDSAPSPPPPTYPPPGDLITKNQVDALLTAKIAAQVPGMIATAVNAAVATAAARIPRVTSATAATLPSGSGATAALSASDSANPQNLALALGIPRGQDASIVGVPPGLLLLAATLPAGVREWTFSFPAAYAAPPFVFPAIRRPAGAPDAVFVGDVSALSETAATITLSAPTPAAGYTLTLQVFAAQ